MKTIRLFGIFFLLVCSVEVFCQAAVVNNNSLSLYKTNSNISGFGQDKDGKEYLLKTQKYEGAIKGSCSTKNAIVIYTSTNAYPLIKDPKNQIYGWFKSQKLVGEPISISVSDNHILIFTKTNAYAFFQKAGSFFWKELTIPQKDGEPQYLPVKRSI
jgi:hypothetical protein